MEKLIMNSQLDGAGSGVFGEESVLDVYILALPDVEKDSESPKPVDLSLRRDDARRHERVATAAYYLAANRGFEPGYESEDWSLAELQTDAIDAGRKS
jgi:hypothetical protein